MTHSLLRRIAAALALSALILGAAIRPALADRKDALKILGGLAALYVLNEAVERNRERRVEVPSSRGMPGAAQGAQGGLWVHSHGPEGEHAHIEGTDHDAAHGARSAAPARARPQPAGRSRSARRGPRLVRSCPRNPPRAPSPDARARGASEAFLEVAEDNRAARALYARGGWAPVGRRPGYYGGGDALILRRGL